MSIVLIWLHVYSLGFMVKAETASIKTKDLWNAGKTAVVKKDISSGSLMLIIFPLVVIIVLNLVEIGYFIYSNYVFNDLIVSIGGAILVGYTLHSMIKFLPKIMDFIGEPFRYLVKSDQGYENVLSYIMVPLEIIFCSYIIVKVFIFLFNL